MKYLFMILVVFGCAKNGSSTESSDKGSGAGYDNNLTLDGTKSLFSRWTNSSTGTSIDFSSGAIGASSFTYIYSTGEVCTCSANFTNDYYSSTTFTGCTYKAGTGSGTDPGCSSKNSVGSDKYIYVKLYTEIPTQLVICIEGTTTCNTYE